eukprot:13633185-Ditylum_brightwellii.AAC.1
MAKAKGHMACIRKNVRSTLIHKANETADPPEPSDNEHDFHLTQQPVKTHEVYLILKLAEEFDHTIYSDLTGNFPVTSQASNKYVLVAYNYDSNGIIAVPVPN